MSTTYKIFAYLLLVFLGFLTFRMVIGGEFTFLHNVDLMFHEAGHMFFMFFGEFIQFLGGTLMQLLIPLVCGLVFLRQKDYYAATVMLWWLGENFYDVSIYIADASAQALQLIGGEHDWHYLLGELNMLAYDEQIAGVVHGLGIFLMLAALVLGVVAIQKAGPGKKELEEQEKYKEFLMKNEH